MSKIQVIAAVISRGEYVLVAQRAREKRHGGLWEFPGGKSELGESMFDTVQRELREELDVSVVNVGKQEFQLSDPDSPFVIVFVPVTIAGEPICNEHLAIQWMRLDELLNLPLAPTDRKYVEFRFARQSEDLNVLVK